MSKLITIKNDHGNIDTIGISTNNVHLQDKSTLIVGNEMISIQFECSEIISIKHEIDHG